MPRKIKEPAQTSLVEEEVTFAVVNQRADEALEELDRQEFDLNSHIVTGKGELAAIATARETRAAHLESLRHEVGRLEAAHSQERSYALLTGGTSAVISETSSKLAASKRELADAQSDHDQAEATASARETQLLTVLPDLQEKARAVHRECESIEAARDRASTECGQRRTSEAKQALAHHREDIKAAQRALKEKEKALADYLKSIETEFIGNGWSAFFDGITEFVEDLDLKEELEDDAEALEDEE